jgi:hypothetical protein
MADVTYRSWVLGLPAAAEVDDDDVVYGVIDGLSQRVPLAALFANLVASDSVGRITTLTQAAYDAIVTPDPSILYVITNVDAGRIYLGSTLLSGGGTVTGIPAAVLLDETGSTTVPPPVGIAYSRTIANTLGLDDSASRTLTGGSGGGGGITGDVYVSTGPELVAAAKVPNNGVVVIDTSFTYSPPFVNHGSSPPNNIDCGVYVASGTHVIADHGVAVTLNGNLLTAAGGLRPIVVVQAGGSFKGDLYGGNPIVLTDTTSWAIASPSPGSRCIGGAGRGKGSGSGLDPLFEYVWCTRVGQGFGAFGGGGNAIQVKAGHLWNWGMALTDGGGAHGIYAQDRVTIGGYVVAAQSSDPDVTTEGNSYSTHLYGNGGGDVLIQGLFSQMESIVGLGGYTATKAQIDNCHVSRTAGPIFRLGQGGSGIYPVNGDFIVTNSRLRSATHYLARVDDQRWSSITWAATTQVEYVPNGGQDTVQIGAGNTTPVTKLSTSPVSAGAGVYEFYNAGGVRRAFVAKWKGASLPSPWVQKGATLIDTSDYDVVEAQIVT